MNMEVVEAGSVPTSSSGSGIVELKLPLGRAGSFTTRANEILVWCYENGVDADFISTDFKDIANTGEYLSYWRICDPQQRTMFVLRWQ